MFTAIEQVNNPDLRTQPLSLRERIAEHETALAVAAYAIATFSGLVLISVGAGTPLAGIGGAVLLLTNVCLIYFAQKDENKWDQEKQDLFKCYEVFRKQILGAPTIEKLLPQNGYPIRSKLGDYLLKEPAHILHDWLKSHQRDLDQIVELDLSSCELLTLPRLLVLPNVKTLVLPKKPVQVQGSFLSQFPSLKVLTTDPQQKLPRIPTTIDLRVSESA